MKKPLLRFEPSTIQVRSRYAVLFSESLCSARMVHARRYFLVGVLHCQRMRVTLCYELISSADWNKQTARGRSTQCNNNSDPVTLTSELLLRQNSVTSHARRIASDHCATENHRPKSAVWPMGYSYTSIICIPVTLLQSIVSNSITGWSYLPRRITPTLAVPEKPNSLPRATLSTLR
jgi:hypothetical protein